jgi:(p)ppGpp synthase/HD superfamily hydrolase
LSCELGARFREALAYACQLHATQRRKGSDVPYVAHLLSVAAIALEHGATEDEAIAALLHDAIEDQGGSAVRAEIVRRFGNAVAGIVDGCTDADTIPKPPWRERKEKYLARLPAAQRSVHLVCAADKLHNVRSLLDDHRLLGDELWQRFSGGKSGTLWYYRAVVDALAAASPGPLVDKLARAVAQLERAASPATAAENFPKTDA